MSTIAFEDINVGDFLELVTTVEATGADMTAIFTRNHGTYTRGYLAHESRHIRRVDRPRPKLPTDMGAAIRITYQDGSGATAVRIADGSWVMSSSSEFRTNSPDRLADLIAGMGASFEVLT